MLARLGRRLMSLIGIGLAIAVVTTVTVPIRGPKRCAEEFRISYPELAAQSSIIRRVWARTQGDHWLAAIVVQPFDVEQKPSTVVCHFARTNYVRGRIEIFSGDKVEQLKQVSVSNLAPSTWFQ